MVRDSAPTSVENGVLGSDCTKCTKADDGIDLVLEALDARKIARARELLTAGDQVTGLVVRLVVTDHHQSINEGR